MNNEQWFYAMLLQNGGGKTISLYYKNVKKIFLLKQKSNICKKMDLGSMLGSTSTRDNCQTNVGRHSTFSNKIKTHFLVRFWF